MDESSDDIMSTWVQNHAVTLDSLDPDAPLDDLEPLREVVGDARVVSIGENSHFIREFALLRHRILRFLVERCGFTVHGYEFGFSEGVRVEAWLQGEHDDADLETLLGPFPCPAEIRSTLRQLREYNRGHSRPVRFAGIDIPRAGGSLLPALEPVGAFLAEADPEALPLLEHIVDVAKRCDGASMAAAAPLHQQLPAAEREGLTAGLSRLLQRLTALHPQHVQRHGQQRFDVVRRHLRSACCADYNLHAMAGFMSGGGLSGDMSARDRFMAESVLWHLKRAEPGARVALVAHNAHIQKVPVLHDGMLSALPMGQHLAQTLGRDYLALGLTSAAGNTAALYPDEGTAHGFRVEKQPLDPPAEGSIEAVLAEAGIGLGLIDWRHVPSACQPPDRIRFDSEYLHLPVFEAFDGLLQVPVSTVAEDIGI